MSILAPASAEPDDPGTHKGDTRAQTIRDMEELQHILDENDRLRAKYVALQTQVAPPKTDLPEPIVQQSDSVLSPQECESLRAELELTLQEYRTATVEATKLNAELEQQYRRFNAVKFEMRRKQEELLENQNQIAAGAHAAFRIKQQRLNENWATEHQRLQVSFDYLKGSHAGTVAELAEFQEQFRSQEKGIQELLSSIQIAQVDIREFESQNDILATQLAEFEELQQKHQESELVRVKLSDEFDDLRTQVETNSLTAKVRREMEEGNQMIDDLNRNVDQVQNRVSSTKLKINELNDEIAALETRWQAANKDTEAVRLLIAKLTSQRAMLRENIARCSEESDWTGGENVALRKLIQTGFGIEKDAPWMVRKELLSLKGELRELEAIETARAEFEENLESVHVDPVSLPIRKRIPLIAISKINMQ
jgi:chromosome segregation ATPase